MMFDAKTTAYVRKTCEKIIRAIDLVEAANDNREICLVINQRLKLDPVQNPRTGNSYRVILDAADDYIHNLAFTALMVIMGERIPNSLYCYHDYSILYGNLGDQGETWDDE